MTVFLYRRTESKAQNTAQVQRARSTEYTSTRQHSRLRYLIRLLPVAIRGFRKNRFTHSLSRSLISRFLPNSIHICFEAFLYLGPPAKPILPALVIPSISIESLHKPIGPNPTETKQKQNAPTDPKPQFAIRHPFPCCADRIHPPGPTLSSFAVLPQPSRNHQTHPLTPFLSFCVLCKPERP